jgi:hypothetical protein
MWHGHRAVSNYRQGDGFHHRSHLPKEAPSEETDTTPVLMCYIGRFGSGGDGKLFAVVMG